MNLDKLTVVTTNGDTFTGEESAHLAYLVAKRFGFEWASAAAAWRRMLENSCPDYQYEQLAMTYVDTKLDKAIEESEDHEFAGIPKRYNRVCLEEC